VQQKGCGQVNGLSFKLTCSHKTGEQRAERRYDTYSDGIRQFDGAFKITSMAGSRISLKQTFRTTGPFFLLAVERGGRLYAVENGKTIATGATVGTAVRVNTVHETGKPLRVDINGSLKFTSQRRAAATTTGSAPTARPVVRVRSRSSGATSRSGVRR
jgi:hypothetical protein